MPESLEVVVALVGQPWSSDPDAIDLDCPSPYKDRAKISLKVETTDSLRAVLDEAATHFRDSQPGDYTDAGRSLAFYQGDPFEGVELYIPATTTLTITSTEGLAIWHVLPAEASMGDLVLANQRKVFKGDPLRPYLVVDPKWGMAGGVPGDWETFLRIWEVLLIARGSWDVLKTLIGLTESGWELLRRAAASWDRHRKAALYCRQMFENRGADIMDVIETARAAASYQLADIMAWTGIDDPAVAADVAGWSGYLLDEATATLSKDPDERFISLTSSLPIVMSIDGLPADNENAHEEAMVARAEQLRDLGMTE